ncbi:MULTISPECIES: S-methyl-5-thioribose-1-phosphate isomerase [Arhodomonas]|uniref:S-methyl-5-thioribose-1-phosphate isomerase n=1 Tax=Arhodomonas TaxID=2368 RepID=UPI000366320D|nr:S-methyl-5-thioribose-1-phosphate isomerase [Arhodomonas aquaeolei]
MSIAEHDRVRAVAWDAADGSLMLLDQRVLPERIAYRRCHDARGVAAAIRDMVVRGAPAIGIAAAYGAAMAARDDDFDAGLSALAASRPTAVNLAWALARMREAAAGGADAAALLAEAQALHDADVAANRRMGELGAERLGRDCGVLTHCNTGSLATAGFGTALGVIRTGWAAGRIRRVFADETRPWLQGARLTAWELLADGIPVEVIADAAAASLMRTGVVDWVIVGADRVSANGDVANKIGTYPLALAARALGVGFMVVAPFSTLDYATASGADIPIEYRDAEEVLSVAGQRIAAPGAGAWNPVFDVTPASLVDVLVTERGVVERPDTHGLAALAQE